MSTKGFDDLYFLDVGCYCKTPKGIAFIPIGLTKQSRAGKTTCQFFFSRFSADELICPVSTGLYIHEENRASPSAYHAVLLQVENQSSSYHA